MTKQIRTTLLTGLFFFGLLTGLQAQDKYAYTFIEVAGNVIQISIDGKEKKEIEINKDDKKNLGYFNLAIREIKIMENEGWELFNTIIIPLDANGTTTDINYVYQLRKKIN